MGRRLSRLPMLVIFALGAMGSGALAQQSSLPLPDAPAPNAIPLRTAPGGFIRRAPEEILVRQPLTPARLNGRQKYKLAYRRIVSIQTPVKTAFVSGFELAAGTGPDLPTNGWGAFAKRLGYNGLNESTTIFFATAFVPALAHEDPRYPVLGQGSARTRILWAVKHEFVGFSDDGREMPNYGNLVGLGLASITANAYSPRGSVGYGDTVESYLIKIAIGTGFNVAREFKVRNHVKAFLQRSKANPH